MPDLVQLIINGKAVSAPKGTLVIEAAKQVGIEIPAFCYYEGYSLQAACRMCLVEVEKMPKLVPGCTLLATWKSNSASTPVTVADTAWLMDTETIPPAPGLAVTVKPDDGSARTAVSVRSAGL